MKNTILKPHVTFSKGSSGGILRENPLLNIGVDGGHYIVQGGFVMYEDGTVVEDPPARFWAEYAKVAPDVQEGVNLNALTRKPFEGDVATKADIAAQADADAAKIKAQAEKDAAEALAKATAEATKRAEETAAKLKELQEKGDKETEARKQADADAIALLEAEDAAAAKKAAEAEASKSKK